MALRSGLPSSFLSDLPKSLLLLDERVIEALGIDRGTSHQPAPQICPITQAVFGATGDAVQAATRGISMGTLSDTLSRC
jgi:hypothetical protein